MRGFLKLLIHPLLEALCPRVVVEVGAHLGATTDALAEWARANGAVVHAIDPDPNLSVERLASEHGEHLRFHRARSLEVLERIAGVDLALIDGDHNWYTVTHELRLLEQRAKRDGNEPPVVLLRETGWPYGRRDAYEDPEAIPEAYRQPHARGGVVPGRAELGPGLNDHRQHALLDDTPANGVLTAAEDFIAAAPGRWRCWTIPGIGGTAVLATSGRLRASAPLSAFLESTESAAFLRLQCEAIEQARIESQRKRATLARRLAETQLRQVMPSSDPREVVELKRTVRQLTDTIAQLGGRLERVDELEEQLRVLAAAGQSTSPASADADLAAARAAEPDPPDRRHEDRPQEGAERDAWRTLLDLYLPLLERALPCADGRDPLSLPCPVDVLGVLAGPDDEQEPGCASVDVVVCVHDALDELRRCLWSLLAKTGRRFRLILVNDGSDAATTSFLRAFAERNPAATLIERDHPPHGYTLAANRGLELAASDSVVLLNSDTVVSAGWLARLVAHGEERPTVGVLGPLSNAATHQSVPDVRHDGAWAVNALPAWLTVDGMALILERGVPRVDWRPPFLNGFCYAIRRRAIEAVGLLDEAGFPDGYCEENDYSQRVRQAGYELAVADDTYVHHAKSRSFGADGRAELAKRNYELFMQKHGSGEIRRLVSEMEADPGLAAVRAAVAQRSSSPAAIAPLLERPDGPLSIVFLLPGLARGGSGGSHSVYQEARALRRLGIPARIALPRWDGDRAAEAYDDTEGLFQSFDDAEDLAAKTADADVISATHHKSVAMLAEIRSRRSDFLPAYYVQDYEPFFTAPYLAEEAIASYTAIPDMLLFAKSHWLCNVVAERHGLFVEKVEASVDEELFTAAGRDVEADREPRHPPPLRVLAMVRPRTARRQPLATVAVLRSLQEQLAGEVSVATFGCYADELREILPGAEDVLESHLGMLSRAQVAERLRETDVFLDMSVYQAFGRTALEAMACGATAVVPAVGGASEFVVHGRNGLIVDTFGIAGVLAALSSLAGDRSLLQSLKLQARETARGYSSVRAALSEYIVFERAYRTRFAAAAPRPGEARELLTRG